MTGTGDSDNRYRYTSNNAMIYDTFEIAGTTYEIGFRRVAGHTFRSYHLQSGTP